MVSLDVCYCTQLSNERIKIIEADITQTIGEFKKTITERIGCDGNIDMIYCGTRTEDDKTLSSVGIKNGSTVYVFKSLLENKFNESMDDTELWQTILAAIKSTLAKPASKNSINKVLHDPETLRELIEASPGLGADPVALSLLRDPAILATLSKMENLKKVLNQHPSFGLACLFLASYINGESGQTSYAGSYSLDEMSDDEEMPSPHLLRQPTEGSGQITTTQLMAALASAQTVSPQSVPSPSLVTSGARARVSSTFLSDSMQQAQSTAPPNLTTRTPQLQTIETQLAQLRDMGITDETVARQALEATGGDIQAALELIFGGHGGDL